MKGESLTGKLLTILMITLSMSCSDEENLDCVVKEAIVKYHNPNGNIELSAKFIYTHDGSHYSKIEVFYTGGNSTFPETPSNVVTLFYNGDKISEVRFGWEEGSDDYSRILYSYPEEGVILKQTQSIADGVVVNENTITFSYLVTPEDGLHLTQNVLGDYVLLEYKNGNLLKVGFESPDGEVDAFDKKWRYEVFYKYDKLPYLMKDYALRYAIGVENDFSVTRNNVQSITLLMPDDVSFLHTYTWKAELNGDIKSYRYNNNGKTVTFEYACK